MTTSHKASTRVARANRPCGGGRRTLAILAFAATLAAPVAISGAQEIDELNSRIQGAQGEADRLGASIEATTSRLAAAQQEAAAASAREARLDGLLAAGRERAAALSAELAAARTQLAAARERHARASDALAQRLVDIYKSSSPGAVSLLLDSEGFDDLASRAELLDRIQAADAALVGRVRELRAEIADHAAAVDAAHERQEAHNAQLGVAREQIAAVRSRAAAQAAALAEARSSQAAALAGLRSNMERWADEVQELRAVSTAEAQEEVESWVGEWAIPEAIVMCESGGDYGAVNPSSGAGGAYQILPSTWELYGGEGNNPEDASRSEQDRIAAEIWADSGGGAWVCAG